MQEKKKKKRWWRSRAGQQYTFVSQTHRAGRNLEIIYPHILKGNLSLALSRDNGKENYVLL